MMDLWKSKCPITEKIILNKNKEKSLLHFKTYCETVMIKAMWYWH